MPVDWEGYAKTLKGEMTTNDRRKTFATPLEFWQWAIMEPGKRKAKARTGGTFYLSVTQSDTPMLNAVVHCFVTNNGDTYLLLPSEMNCPLTAVEDEHGAIPEAEPTFELRHPKTTLGEVANWLEDIAVCKDEGDRLGASRQAAHFIRKLIREEIAAATVVVRDECGGGWKGGWSDTGYRLKPKEE